MSFAVVDHSDTAKMTEHNCKYKKVYIQDNATKENQGYLCVDIDNSTTMVIDYLQSADNKKGVDVGLCLESNPSDCDKYNSKVVLDDAMAK
tara:strand:+ start:155 stop:427 length:273 start_codon:yes stop_codon:yes gene_type:complete